MEDADRAALAQLARDHRNRSLEYAEVWPSPYVKANGFLPQADRDELFKAIVAAESEYVSNAMDGRRALVLYPAPAIAELFAAQILRVAPSLVEPLGFRTEDLVAPTARDLAVTASGHGDFFGPHRDDTGPLATPETQARRVSLAFHLNSVPKRFEGGELRLYDYRVFNDESVPANTFAALEPEDNTLIAFLSSTRHDVASVRFEDNAFAGRRFSITGSFSIPS
ncbi:Oxoglutarate/iron-dependent dioxygenase [Acidimicrobiia bacterium]